MNSHTTPATSTSLRHDFTEYSKLLAEGAVFIQKDDYAAALEKFELAIKDCDYLTDAYAEAARACMKLTQTDEAIKYYQQAIARHSSNLVVLKELATFYLLQKQDNANYNKYMDKCKEIAPRENKFRRDYYTDMRHFITKRKHSDADAAKIIHSAADDFSPVLSNNAVVDAFLGEEAYKRNEIAIAFYHFTRATEKFRHDCYSDNRRAEIYFLKLKLPKEGEEILLRTRNLYLHPASFIHSARLIQNLNEEEQQVLFQTGFHEAQLFHFHSELFHNEELKIIILKSINSIKAIKAPSQAQKSQIEPTYKKIHPVSLSGSLTQEESWVNIRILKNVIKIDPCNPIPYQAIGLTYWSEQSKDRKLLRLAVVKLSVAMWLAHLANNTKLLEELIQQRKVVESSLAAIEEKENASSISKKAVFEQNIEYKKYCKTGQRFIENGYYLEAMAEYQKAIKLHPYLFDAYFLVAEAEAAANRLQKALDLYDDAKKYFPEYPEIYKRSHALYLRMGEEIPTAMASVVRLTYLQYNTNFKERKAAYINQLKDVLVTCPPSAEINSVITAFTEKSLSTEQDKAIEFACIANMVMGTKSEAAFFYHSEASDLMLVDLISRYNYYFYVYQKKLITEKELLRICTEHIEEYNYGMFNFLRGRIYKDLGHDAHARADFLAALPILHFELLTNEDVVSVLVETLLGKKSSLSVPEQAELLKNTLASMQKFNDSKRHSEASVDLMTAINANPGSHELYAELGKMEIAQGFYRKASATYALAIVCAFRDNCHDEVDDYDEIRTDLFPKLRDQQQAIVNKKRKIFDMVVFQEWFKAEFIAYSRRLSVEDMNAPELCDDHMLNITTLAYQIFLNEKYDIAIDIATESLLQNPDNFIAQTLRGIFYLKQNQLEAAIADFQDVIDDCGYYLAYWGLAVALHQQGNLEEAAENYLEALASGNKAKITFFEFNAEIFELIKQHLTLDIPTSHNAADYYQQGLEALAMQAPRSARVLFSLALWRGDSVNDDICYFQRSRSNLQIREIYDAWFDMDLFIKSASDNHKDEKLINGLITEWGNDCLSVANQFLADNLIYLALSFLQLGFKIEGSKRFEKAIKSINSVSSVTAAPTSKKIRKRHAPRNGLDAKVKTMDFSELFPHVLSQETMVESDDNKSTDNNTPTSSSTKREEDRQRRLKERQARKNVHRLRMAAEEDNIGDITQAILPVQQPVANPFFDAVSVAERKCRRARKAEVKQQKKIAREKKADSSPELTALKSTELISHDLSSDDSSENSFDMEISKNDTDRLVKLLPSGSKITLTNIEVELFNRIDTLTATRSQSYRTYLVGGSVFDRALDLLFSKLIAALQENPNDALIIATLDHPIFDRFYKETSLLIDDIDIVTELPIADIEAIAKFMNLKPVKQYHPDVRSFVSYHGVKIDIMHKKNIISAEEEVKERIFCQLFALPNGELLDPTGHAIDDLIHHELTTIIPFEQAYIQYPTAFFSALRQHIKRNLDIPSVSEVQGILSQLSKLIHSEQSDLTAATANAYLKKLFNNHMLINSYETLTEYNVLAAFFCDEIAQYIKNGNPWIMKKLQEANSYTFPKRPPTLQQIYAVLIVAVAMQKPSQEIISIVEFCKKIIGQFPLFADVFKDFPEAKYESFFIDYIKDWQQYQNITIAESPLLFWNSQQYPSPAITNAPISMYAITP